MANVGPKRQKMGYVIHANVSTKRNSEFVSVCFQGYVMVVYQKVEEFNTNAMHKVLKYVVWSKPEGGRILQAQWNLQIESQQVGEMSSPPLLRLCCDGWPLHKFHMLWGHWKQVKAHRVAQVSFPYSTGNVKFLFSLQAASLLNRKFHFPGNVRNTTSRSKILLLFLPLFLHSK